jgi:hypothetical protein
MKPWAIAGACLALALPWTVGQEIRAEPQISSTRELEKFIVDTVRNNSVFDGPVVYLNDVTAVVCPRVNRKTLDALVGSPGSLQIRTVDDVEPLHGIGRGYYRKPSVSVLDGLTKWLTPPGLQIELKEDRPCFAAVRRGDAI